MEDLYGIQTRRQAVEENIEKAFDLGFDADNNIEGIEKAKHQVGDIHPNGRWVWTEYAPGKFDWKSLRGKHHKGNTQQNFEESVKKTSNAEVDNFMDKVKTFSNKYSDESKIIVEKTPKGNWDVSYDGHRLGIINANQLSEKTAKEKGWLKEEKKEDKQEEKNDEVKKIHISDLAPGPVKINGKIYKRLYGRSSNWIDEDGNTVGEYELGDGGWFDPRKIEEVTSYNQDEVMSDDDRNDMPGVYKGLILTVKDSKYTYSGNINGKNIEFIANKDYEGAWEVWVDGEDIEDRASNLGAAFKIARKEINKKKENKKQ